MTNVTNVTLYSYDQCDNASYKILQPYIVKSQRQQLRNSLELLEVKSSHNEVDNPHT